MQVRGAVLQFVAIFKKKKVECKILKYIYRNFTMITSSQWKIPSIHNGVYMPLKQCNIDGKGK